MTPNPPATLRRTLPAFHLWLLGPNGFHHHVAGRIETGRPFWSEPPLARIGRP